MTDPTEAEIKRWKQCYSTPPEFMSWAEKKVLPMFGETTFTLDVCAEAWNTRCGEYIAPPWTVFAWASGCIATDGLTTDWKTTGAAWCNPGFENVWPWARQARRQAELGQFSVMLTHATHAADWAQWTIKHASACILVNPRINFIHDPRLVSWLESQGKKPTGNNRDSMLWVFAPANLGQCRFINPEPWKKRGKAAA